MKAKILGVVVGLVFLLTMVSGVLAADPSEIVVGGIFDISGRPEPWARTMPRERWMRPSTLTKKEAWTAFPYA